MTPANRTPAPTPADSIVALLPPAPAGTTAAEYRILINSVVGAALRLTGIVHLEDPADAARLLDGLSDQKRALLPLVLAAMVNIDRTADELLGWLRYSPPTQMRGVTAVAPSSVLMRQRPGRRRIAECGTHNGFNSHVNHGEDPCDECLIANAAWERDRKRRATTRKGEELAPALVRNAARNNRARINRAIRSAQAAAGQQTLPIDEEIANVA